MILDGELTIAHKGHHEKQLKSFEVDSFMGDWETEAKGCVTDFNLMLSADMKGRLDHVRLNDQQVYRFDSENRQFVGLYIWKGSIRIDESDLQLQEGDFVIFYLNESEIVPKVIATEKNTDLILSFIAHR
ncbi:MAG: HutD family protein [Marinilabiliaceae bacterium]|nr:HutD family protein [Marinilabiliaceae bacterium]